MATWQLTIDSNEPARMARFWAPLLGYVPEAPRDVAVVPAGYADGVDTRLANRGFALVRGRRASIVGSVCMDMIMLDVTGLGVETGDEVVLIGSQGDEQITAREIASTIGTIPWEVVCRLGSRIVRSYDAGTA